MIAVDTNILVRYLLAGDDPRQAAKARRLVIEEEIYVPTTVLLETEWVLRAKYQIEHRQIVAAFLALAGVPNVTVQSRSAVVRALKWSSTGVDFADALHIALAGDAHLFMTFDRDLVKHSRSFEGCEVRLL